MLDEQIKLLCQKMKEERDPRKFAELVRELHSLLRRRQPCSAEEQESTEPRSA